MSDGDTIAALATAPGVSALSVVRVSGPKAIEVADRCFEGGVSLSEAEPRSVQFGRIVASSEILDQVVATVYRAPASPTGEDLVELSCHGGNIAYRRVLSALYTAGAMPARPGEFTERAFVHGKLDLAQAEAVADLIHASSESAQRIAVRQLEGRYSELLEKLRTEILDVTAFVELELDFGEEDVEFADRERLQQLVKQGSTTLNRLLGSVRVGDRIRDGIRVVIAGRPNAGKSTLLNALLGADRAIVSPDPGTTRDTIEAEAEVGGLLLRFVDTAGVRQTDDEIESSGVRRAVAAAESADVVLYVYDGTRGLGADEREDLPVVSQTSERVLLLANKSDLMSEGDRAAAVASGAMTISAESARMEEALLDPVLNWITEKAVGDINSSDHSAIVMHERHVAHLRQAKSALQAVASGLKSQTSGDLLALDLRRAAHELGCITGVISNEEVLGAIFSRFCIGK